MAARRVLSSSARWRDGGIVLALGGLRLAGVGLGTALDYLVAQSHPIGATPALLLRDEYTLAGLLLLIVGGSLTRKAPSDGGATD